ncbi:hypothetical protein J2X36_004270 [Methylobacterium sp. BE186]|uniref:hypothetical protein n=1 Tax=Methylobacterium sp. BE186 TaxID=2817715 RepID=UPI00286083F8|nr:hypothetical protein [Methylobacterium sp. BE186]MDR7039494.1 hypothetical protein [Methylobacterium sp. BE186]
MVIEEISATPFGAGEPCGAAQPLVGPAATLQLIEEAIERCRFVEDEADLISERAQKLIWHTQVERARLQGEIKNLRSALAREQENASLAWDRLEEVEQRANLAVHRAEESERRADDLTRFCVLLIDAIEPLLDKEALGSDEKATLLAFLHVVDQRA